MTACQMRKFNPRALDTIVGYIMKDSKGEGAKNRLPKRRLDILDGNIAAYCKLLNSPDQLRMIREANELASVLADVHNDKQEEKNARKLKRLQEEAEKEFRRTEKEKKAEELRKEGFESSLKTMAELDLNGVGIMGKYKVSELVSLIRFYFNSQDYKDENNKAKKKDGLVAAATSLYLQHQRQQQLAQEDKEENQDNVIPEPI